MIKGLPKKLKDLRIKYGYSQKEIASKLGLSPSIVSGYETGERTPSIDVLLAISYLYNCTTDYLLGKEANQTDAIINLQGLTNNQIQAIYKLVDSIKNNK